MQIITLFNKLLNTRAIFILIFSMFLLNSCGIYKRSDVKDNPINDADKRAKNINEGRGFSLGGLGKKGLVLLSLLRLMKCGELQLKL